MVKSKQDYLREMQKLQYGEHATWDSTATNNISTGDLFCFVSNIENWMRCFRVMQIRSTQHRIQEWDIPQHCDRKVLVLSENYTTVNFHEYKIDVGYKLNYVLRGTAQARTPSGNILAQMTPP